MEPIRKINGLLRVERTTARPMPKPTNAWAKLGLSYEKRVGAALARMCGPRDLDLELQAWFNFIDATGAGSAVPDAVIYNHARNLALVIETKLTWVPEAELKLRALYLPLVEAHTGLRAKALVICKNLTPAVCHTVDKASEALAYGSAIPTLQWLGHGAIEW